MVAAHDGDLAIGVDVSALVEEAKHKVVWALVVDGDDAAGGDDAFVDGDLCGQSGNGARHAEGAVALRQIARVIVVVEVIGVEQVVERDGEYVGGELKGERGAVFASAGLQVFYFGKGGELGGAGCVKGIYFGGQLGYFTGVAPVEVGGGGCEVALKQHRQLGQVGVVVLGHALGVKLLIGGRVFSKLEDNQVAEVADEINRGFFGGFHGDGQAFADGFFGSSIGHAAKKSVVLGGGVGDERTVNASRIVGRQG